MKKKITIDQLKPGMHVVSTNRNWLQLPFFKKKISSESVVEKLRNYRVTELIIDTTKGIDVNQQSEVDSLAEAAEAFQQNLGNADGVHEKVLSQTSDMMDRVRRGEMIDDKAADAQVGALTDQLFEDAQSLLCVSVLRNSDEFTFDHSVNTTILALFIGKHLEFSKQELFTFGKGALLHDIGKCMMPLDILRKPGKLSHQESELMREHVMRGHNYLLKAGNFPQEVLNMASQHHEWVNGKGYPNGLKGDEISWFSKLAAVMDVYDSLLHKNFYKDEETPSEVISFMETGIDKQFDSKAYKAVLDTLGPFPPGTSLMLDTGEIGVSFAPNSKMPDRPCILIVTQAGGGFLREPVHADLAEMNEDGSFKRTVISDVTEQETVFNPLDVLAKHSPKPT